MIKGDFKSNGTSKHFRLFKTGEFFGEETLFLTLIISDNNLVTVERFHTETNGGDDSGGAWVRHESRETREPFWTVVSQESDFLSSL